jgi:FkbM family methyltransferase
MSPEEFDKKFRYQEHGLPEYFDKDFAFLWPRRDESLHGDIPTLKDLDAHVFPIMKKTEVVVQAGGAMGMWAKRFAQVFDYVYTFEPTPDSFYCCSFNCPEDNIVCFNAALGEKRGMVQMAFPEHKQRSHAGKDNLGGFRCFPGGYTPTLLLDDLALPICDLMFLDLEGFELMALKGAAKTIEKCRPVIIMEDKGCSQAFMYAKGDVEKHLQKVHNYKTLKRFHGGRDVICVPDEF